ncbi:heme exporter protein CcmD [Cognatishimia sp. SS12]|nr:heme exporter protein CcmD [Cognatishimia sp. SS12]MDC0738527.1 heme exporter protein CcmD [Cognatishimia sp. SS12]
MMPDLGKYAFTVLAAYGASLALLLGLIWMSLRAARRAARDLAEVEQRNG